jgi:hypothetical protein
MRNFNAPVQKKAKAALAAKGLDTPQNVAQIGALYRDSDPGTTVEQIVESVVDAFTDAAPAADAEATVTPITDATAKAAPAKKASKGTKATSGKKASGSGTKAASKKASSGSAPASSRGASSGQGTPAQQEVASRSKAPRKTVQEQIMFAALENDWKPQEHKLGSKADQDIKILNPRRGTRDWSCTFTKEQATFHVSTLRNKITGVQHADGCWLVQDGKTKLVAYVYEIIGTLSNPFVNGLAVIPTKDEARKRPAKAEEEVSA